MTKQFFLKKPSEPADANDIAVARDLVDTLQAHRATCIGMAANMIGVRKQIIAVVDGNGGVLTMLNPEIISTDGAYDTEEGCLSLPGMRPTRRFEHIRVRWQDEQMAWREESFEGRVAQAIQHEVDHCEGILI